MRLPSLTRSLRFRLSGMTSVVAFGIGGLALAAVYLIVRSGVRSLTMRSARLTGTVVDIGGDPHIVVGLEEVDVRTVESIVREFILNQIAVSAIVVLVSLFAISALVGWIVAGRALRPLKAMTSVAEEIQATDLQRRIEVDGPDDEMKTMARTFNRMLDRLDTAFRGQQRFLAETSHDLRTPLATIRSNVDVALADPDAGVQEWRETGEVVARSALHMSEMLDDLLATARMQVSEMEAVDVDLGAVVRQVVADLEATGQEQSTRFELDVTSVVVMGDRRLLERAVANVVTNAMKASPEGGVVGVSVDAVGGQGRITVSDGGPGFDPAIVAGDVSTPGLGLSIVRDIAGRHGGSVSGRPRTDGGAEVVIALPIGGADEVSRRPDPAGRPEV